MPDQEAPPTAEEIAAAQDAAPPTPAELAAASLPPRLAKWAGPISDAAARTAPAGVGADQWGAAISAVMDRESNGNADAIGDEGHAHGLMQVNDRFHDFAKGPDAMDPAKNVAYGASYLKDLFEKLPPDMPYDEKITRAAAAYNGGPAHLTADEPDSGTTGNDYGTDVLHRSKGIDLSVLAHQAVSGPSQKEAAANFTIAQGANVPVGVVAADPKLAQARAEQPVVAASLVGAPVLAAAMAESPQHAAVLGSEAQNLSFIERWFSGTSHSEPNRAAAYANAGIDYPVEPQRVVDAPPVVVTALGRAAAQLSYEWEGFKLYGMQRLAKAEAQGPDPFDRAQGAPVPKESDLEEWDRKIAGQQKRVERLKNISVGSQTPEESQSAQFPQEAIRGAAGLVPYLASGPAAPAVLAMQTIGHLTAEGVDSDRAALGGVAAGLLGTVGAEAVTAGLGSAAEAAGVSKLVQSAVPKLWQAGAQYVPDAGRSAVNGWLMTALTGYTERMTLVRDQAIRAGREVDPSEYAAEARKTLSDANAALPFLALLGGLHVMGRFAEAHGNAAAHDALTAPLKDTQVPDDVLRDTLRKVADAQRTKNLLLAAQAEAEARGADVQPFKDAAERASARYVDPEHFDGVMRATGQDPEQLAARASGDGGASYRFAKQVGGLFRVPIENYLVDLRPWHESLRDGVAADVDGATLTRDGGEALVRGVQEPFDNAKLKQIAARGSGKVPTDGEVGQVFDKLRSLGFKVPPLESVLPKTGEKPARPTGLSPIEAQQAEFEAARLISREKRIANGEGGVVAIEDQLVEAHDKAEGGGAPTLSTEQNAYVKQIIDWKKGQQTPTGPAKEAAPSAPLPEVPVKTEPPVYQSKFAQKLYADMQVRGKTIDQLRIARGTYKGQATKAQNAIDRLTTRTVNLLSSAEQSAQQGIDEALGAADSARESSVSRGFAGSVTARQLENQIRKIVTQGRMAGIDPSAVPADVNDYVADAIKKAASKAVKDAKLDPATVRSIINKEIKQSNIDYRESVAGSQKAEDKSNVATAKTVEAGDNAAEIDELKKKRDLNTAFHEAKEAALKRADKITENVQSLKGDDTRTKLYNNKASGHPEYGWGYDMIMEGLGLRQPDASYRPQDFQEVADALNANGEQPQFDVDGIRALAQSPKGPGDLTVDQLANADSALTQLQHLASERSKNYVAGKMVERSEIINNDIAPTAAALASVPHPLGWRIQAKIIGKGVKDRLDAAYSDFHTLLSQAGKWGLGQEKRFIEVRFGENQLLSRYAKLFEAMPDALKKLGDTDVPTPEGFSQAARGRYGDSMKRRDVWYGVLRSGTEEGLAGLSRGLGMEPPQVVEWLHSVANTPEEWEFFKSWWKNAEEIGDMESAADANRAGLPMVRKKPRTILAPTGETVSGGYAPDRYFDPDGAMPAKVEKDPTKGVNALRDTEHGFLDAVVEHARVPDLSFDNLPTHIRAVAKDLSMGDFVRDQARMINDPDFKKAVAPLGDDYYNALVRWHNTVATGQMQQTYDALTRHWFTEKARGFAARVIFNLNYKAAFNLVGHMPFAKMIEGGDLDLSAGIAKGMTSTDREYAMNTSAVLRNRSERWLAQLREQEQLVLGEAGQNRAFNLFRTPSQAMWHMADTQLGQTLWHGLRESAMQRGLSEGEANSFAEVHTDRLMPSMDIYGKPAIASNPWIGTFVLARNFESTVWNAKARAEIQTRLGIADGTVQGWTRYHAQMLGVAGALGLGYYAFGGNGRNEAEQKNGWIGWGQMIGRNIIDHYTYGSYVLHLAAQSFSAAMVGEGLHVRDMALFEAPEAQQARAFVNDLGKVAQNAIGNGAPSKALLAGLDAGSRLLGVRQPVNSAIGFARVAKYRIFDQNDFQTTPRTYIGDAGKIWYGDVDKYRTNLLSDADEGLAEMFDSLWRK